MMTIDDSSPYRTAPSSPHGRAVVEAAEAFERIGAMTFDELHCSWQVLDPDILDVLPRYIV
jgi:hypothetical protein